MRNISVCLLVIGVLLFTTIMAQDCPDPGTGFGTCINSCTDNSNCTNGQICCSNGCGYQCMTPACATVLCATPSCHELSPGTITPEGECCPVCACTATDGSMVAAETSFMDDCNTCVCGSNGLAGCTRIACPPTTESTTSTPTTSTPTDANTLPTSSPSVMCPNVTGLIGQCYEGCSSDVNCTNDQLCCFNGCGHSCMDPVVDCSAVSCLRPNCESPSVLVTPDGSCCPVCGCQTSNGDAVAPGESYQPDSCNTCTCFENGIAACTLAFCPPTTDSTPTTTDGTAITPTTAPDCPISGQVRVGCASPCSTTCANMNEVLICPTVCVINGCQCPRDTIIDEQSNACVNRSDCPTVSTGQTCPTVQGTATEQNCTDECSSDDDCQYDRICCSNGCGGRVCSDSVEMCQLIQCDWPICEDGVEPVTSPFSCCPFCPTTPTTESSTFTPTTSTLTDANTLPTSSPSVMCPNVTGLIGQCYEGCSSDVNCTNDQLCCFNGCGHSCMDPVVDCSAVSCLRPNCESPSVLVTPDGSCCPVCAAPPRPTGCTAPDGTSVGVGETYMDQCNTCRCLEGGVGACTRKGCVGCTLADGSWVAIGETYKKDCNICTCTDRDVDICTEKACDVVNPGTLDGVGGGKTVLAGLIITLLCGLLSTFF